MSIASGRQRLPVLQLVTIASSVNSIQLSGCVSATLVNTGGNIAVLDRGSTGWLIVFSSASSPDTMESDRNLLVDVP